MRKSLVLIFAVVLVLGCVSQNTQNLENTNSTANTPVQNQQPQAPAIPQQLPQVPVNIPAKSGPIQFPPSSQQPTDSGQVGFLNHQFLQSGHPSILIEIDYVQDHEPTQATKNALRDFFAIEANKTVVFNGGNIIASAKKTYTVDDLKALEAANRKYSATSDTEVIYIMVLNGNAEDTNMLGEAYGASSFALFTERIEYAAGSSSGSFDDMERGVALHELGHLLGLVNTNYRSTRNHEDPDHPGHSINPESIMNWKVEDISFKGVLSYTPDGFDADDLFDIAQIRDGSY